MKRRPMSRERRKLTVFYWVDSKGLPLDIVLAAFVSRGIAVEQAIGSFVHFARVAGWKDEKIRSDVRGLRLLMPLPTVVEAWLGR